MDKHKGGLQSLRDNSMLYRFRLTPMNILRFDVCLEISAVCWILFIICIIKINAQLFSIKHIDIS